MTSNSYAQQSQPYPYGPQPPFPSPAQPGYQQPPAYGPPPIQRFETRTEKGLKYINWGIWLYVIILLLFLAVAVLMYLVISTGNIESGFGPILALVGVACLGLVLYLVVVILWLVGFFVMVGGRDEYGPAHAQKTIIALVCFVLFIIFFVATIFYPITAGVYTTTQDVEEMWETTREMIIVTSVLSFLSTIFLSLTWVFLILELAADGIKKLLWIAFLIIVITSLVGLMLVFSVVNADVSEMSTEDVSAMQNVSNLSSGISIIGFIIVAYCYWKTYKRVRDREIMPVAVPGMPPPIIPPGYPPLYPQRYPPQY